MIERTPQSGFTLLEMMVALAIFAVIGVMAHQLLFQMIQSHAHAEERGLRLADVQRAMQIIQRDVMQIVDRPVRDELGDGTPGLSVGSEQMLELTRQGWRNPLQLPRSDLQRVAYRFDGDTLYRYYWPVLDRAEISEPIRQALLTDVRAAEVSVIDVSGNVHSHWPLLAELAADPDAAPAAISLRIDVAPFGELLRVWDIPAPFAPQPGGAAP
jgi:general secretion pathway protein J